MAASLKHTVRRDDTWGQYSADRDKRKEKILDEYSSYLFDKLKEILWLNIIPMCSLAGLGFVLCDMISRFVIVLLILCISFAMGMALIDVGKKTGDIIRRYHDR